MSTADTLTIRILDKDYQVSCPSEERDALLQSARSLDDHMKSIRNSGNVIGLERIAVMAALNLTYDLSKSENQTKVDGKTQATLTRLNDKLDKALVNLEQIAAF